MQKFYKYQSLGNDFVLFDWMAKSSSEIDTLIKSNNWPKQVQQICDRHDGIGSDGILILRSTPSDPELLMFNSDGSHSETCFNGIRCAIDYLHTQQNYPAQFNLLMFGYTIQCEAINQGVSLETCLTVNPPEKITPIMITINDQPISGQRINMGNPHYVIMEESTKEWLTQYGPIIEHHPSFPNRTNIEFVWPANDIDGHPAYHLLAYERGCGLTLSCGTGAAATLWMLYKSGNISKNKPIYLVMPGGNLLTYINNQDKIVQQAPASLDFTDTIAI